MMTFSLCLLPLLACASLIGHVTAKTAPEIESVGDDLLVTSGDRGDIIFSNAGTVTITLTEIKALMDKVDAMSASVATLTGTVSTLEGTVSTLESTVSNLTGTVADLEFGLATCNNQNSDQEQQFLDMAEKLKQIPKNTQTSSDNGKTIGALKVSQTQAAEGVETKITALSTRLDKQSGDTTPLCPSLSSLSLTDTTIHKSVLDAKHTVGFHVDVECATGFYRTKDSPLDVTCFANLKYCASTDFPIKPCDSHTLPTCKACLSSCVTCLAADTCATCKPGLELINSRCIKVPAANTCDTFNTNGILTTGVNAGLTIALKNGKKSTKGACLLTSDGTAHEMFPCYDLLNEGQRCQPTGYSSYPNTCKTNGYMLAVFRSEEHYKLTYKAFEANMGSHFKSPGAVTHVTGRHPSGRPYTQCAMMKDSTTDTACSRDFQAPDGGDWWIMNKPYSEPNGDLQEFWYLAAGGYTPDGVAAFNDWRSSINTGYFYYCMPKGQ